MRRIMAISMAALIAMGMVAGPALASATGSIGNDAEPRPERDTSWEDWHLIDANNSADIDGTIDAIDYYSKANNPMRFFLVDDKLTVQWVGEEFDAGVGGGTYDLDEPVGVAEGWYLGMYFADTGTIAYEGGGTIYSQDQDSGMPQLNDELNAERKVERTYSLVADITPASPETKDACKAGGWEEFDPEFRNQGQCIRYVNTGKDSR